MVNIFCDIVFPYEDTFYNRVLILFTDNGFNRVDGSYGSVSANGFQDITGTTNTSSNT